MWFTSRKRVGLDELKESADEHEAIGARAAVGTNVAAFKAGG